MRWGASSDPHLEELTLIMPIGHCRLCGLETDLQLSHVVPAFVFRWLRETSGNSHIRGTDAPNRRVQDGPQRHWLCRDCESLIGRSERAFATELFHPYVAASGRRFHYGPWLLKFCVSVSWRNLILQLEHISQDALADGHRQWISEAETSWRKFLLGELANPGRYRQFLLPLDQIDSTSMELSPNINRYLMRAVDIDLCQGGESLFTYSKLGRFVIVGFINEPNPDRWVGGRVGGAEGFVEPRRYLLPATFGDYINEKAGRVRESMRGISPRQASRIEQSFRDNAERLVGSDFFTAMMADVEMFGHHAFAPQTDQPDGH